MISRIARLDALARHRLLLLVGVLVIQPAPALGQSGACCLANAECISTDQAGCDAVSGEYLGAGTSCDGTVCEGACCQSGDTCSEGSAEACASGDFQGADSTCSSHCPGPLGTAFTYQGQLKRGGVPLTGTVDVEASLWSSAVGGEQIGSALARTGVPVTNGLFAVELDFGAPSVFDGSSRWLEIAVRSPHDPTDSGAYVTLTPRQSIQAVPYALHSLQTRGVFVDDSRRVGIGTTQPTHLLDLRHTSEAGIGVFGNGDLDDSHIALGQLPSVYMKLKYDGTSDTLDVVANSGSGESAPSVSIARDSGNVGIGTTTPETALDVVGGEIRAKRSVSQRQWVSMRSHSSAGSFLTAHSRQGNKKALTIANLYEDDGREHAGDNDIVFEVGNESAPTEVMRIVSNPSGPGYPRLVVSAESEFTGVLQPAVRVTSDGPGLKARTLGAHDDGVVGATNELLATGFGVFAQGRLGASGTKSSRIDHPDDPTNKYLLHYATESPEAIYFYRGTVTLDGTGQAEVDLPPYFAKINTAPSYQLTAIGAPMPNLHVAEVIDEDGLRAGAAAGPGVEAPLCSFRIAGGTPGGSVSWRVEARRNDLWVRHYGMKIQAEKLGSHRGKYQQPELYGQPPEMGVYHHPPPEDGPVNSGDR